MKKRDCVRALLFDPMGRLLLFRYRNDPNIHNLGEAPMQTDYWGTVGGGIEAGESLEAAILREIEEETGHRNISLGPLVWHRQVDLIFYGEPMHIDEKYFVARTRDVDISTEGHTQIERKFVAEIKWWDMDALESSKEIIYPRGMATHIRPLQQGIYPNEWLLLRA